MWFIPTRNRPKAMEQVIASMEATDCVPECAVMVDGPSYDIQWPAHWHIHHSTEHLEMQLALNQLFALYPDEPCYGVLTDTSRPQTKAWASKLEAAAGSSAISMCNTTKHRMNDSGQRRITSYVLGGDLARAVGYVWFDKCVHLYGDTVWEDIGHTLGIMRYLDDVVVLALLKREGEVPVDENHNRMWNGKPYMEHDRQQYIAWKRNVFPALIQRLKGGVCSPSLAS